jgi:hypothetical protein
MSFRSCVSAIAATFALAANAQDAPPVVQETLAMQLGSAKRDVDIYRPSASPVGVAIVAHGRAPSRSRPCARRSGHCRRHSRPAERDEPLE